MVRGNRWAATAAVLLGFFVVMLDVTVVNVALGGIGADLRIGIGTLQWVVDAYTLVLAALLLAAGAACDRIGARKVYLIGLLGFGVLSFACAMAPTGGTLVAARAVQGVGAAAVVPGSLTLLGAIHPDPAARARAIGLWGGAGGVAAAVGPILGGMLVTAVGWRSVFWINLPVIAVAVLLTVGAIDGTRGAAPRGLDLFGPGLSALGLAAGTWAVISAGEHGWGIPQLAAAAVGAGLLIGFVAVERRVPEPMLPPGLFAGRGFTVAVTVGFCLNVSFFGQLFVLSLFFQRTLGHDAWEAGLALAPQACSAVVAAPLGGRAAARFGVFPAMLMGLVVGAAGFAGTAFIGSGTAPLVVSGVTFAAGFGMAFAMPAATAAAVSAVPDELAGTAGGVVNAARQTGSVAGVAILGGVVAADASPSGFRVAMLMAAGIFVVAATLVAAAARDPV